MPSPTAKSALEALLKRREERVVTLKETLKNAKADVDNTEFKIYKLEKTAAALASARKKIAAQAVKKEAEDEAKAKEAAKASN